MTHVFGCGVIYYLLDSMREDIDIKLYKREFGSIYDGSLVGAMQLIACVKICYKNEEGKKIKTMNV